MDFLILEFFNFGVLDCGICFCICVFVVLCFWYTSVVSNVLLRVLRTESEFTDD